MSFELPQVSAAVFYYVRFLTLYFVFVKIFSEIGAMNLKLFE